MLDDDEVRSELDEAFERFESAQPALAGRVAEMLNRPLDETALALGYFLTIAIWLAFEHAYGVDLNEVSDSELDATTELLELDEELRRNDPRETLDSEDVIGMEQPNLIEFLHEHIDATLDMRSENVDVNHVHTIYRLVLIELLALSYAVRPPAGYPAFKSEALA